MASEAEGPVEGEVLDVRERVGRWLYEYWCGAKRLDPINGFNIESWRKDADELLAALREPPRGAEPVAWLVEYLEDDGLWARSSVSRDEARVREIAEEFRDAGWQARVVPLYAAAPPEGLVEELEGLLEHAPTFRDYTGTDYDTCAYCREPVERDGIHAESCTWVRLRALLARLRERTATEGGQDG